MKRSCLIWFLLLTAMAVLPGCKEEEPPVETTPSTASLTLTAKTGSSAKEGGPLFAFLGSASEIENVVVTVSQGDKALIENYLLTRQGGSYQGTLSSLPIGPDLVFAGAGLNASGSKIFAGKVTAALTAANQSISLVLSPIDDGKANLFPYVLSLTSPKEVILNQSEVITAQIKGQAGETLQCQFLAATDGGSFDPAEAWVTLEAGQTQGACSSTYTAPATEGEYSHEVKVTNNQGNATQVGFTLKAVYEKQDAGVEVAIAPTIDGVTAKVGKRSVTLIADASDDGPDQELCYQWSLNGSTAAFSHIQGNQATISPYNGTQAGELVITVQDKNCTGLRSSLTYTIAPQQWTVK